MGTWHQVYLSAHTLRVLPFQTGRTLEDCQPPRTRTRLPKFDIRRPTSAPLSGFPSAAVNSTRIIPSSLVGLSKPGFKYSPDNYEYDRDQFQQDRVSRPRVLWRFCLFDGVMGNTRHEALYVRRGARPSKSRAFSRDTPHLT